MAYDVHWSGPQEIVICALSGAVSRDDVLEAIAGIEDVAANGVHPRRVCWDCRAIKELDIRPADVADIVARMRNFATSYSGRTAIVTARFVDHITAELIVAKGLIQKRNRKRFDSMDAALTWLKGI